MSASALQVRQLRAVIAWEWRKAMAGRRWVVPFLLASLPVLPLIVRALFAPVTGADEALERIFAAVFGTYLLRLAVFFSAVAVFVQLYRREVQNRTLHFYLLAPLRRELVIVGKYLTGVGLTGAFFVFGATASYLLLWLPGGHFRDHFLDGPGLEHLTRYLGLLVAGIAILGAVFLLVGTLFRNPIVPVLLIFGFESAAALLPPPLQDLSPTYILTSLAPVALRTPTPSPAGWTALAGPLLLVPVLLAVAAWRMRRADLDYGSD
jgi:ABC-type transport system involved in cytochrome c biogenesis permease component